MFLVKNVPCGSDCLSEFPPLVGSVNLFCDKKGKKLKVIATHLENSRGKYTITKAI